MVAFGHDLKAAAETYFEEWTSALNALSESFGIAITAGGFELTPDDKVMNVLYTASPEGNGARYEKIHLYDAFGYKESDSVFPGERPVVAEIDGEKVGFAVCYDIRFPKLFVENARNGATLSVVSASWGAGDRKLEQWVLLARARALDSGSFVVAVGQADPEITGVDAVAGAPTGIGHSVVVDPFGGILTEFDGSEQLEVVELDLESADAARGATAVLANAKLGY